MNTYDPNHQPIRSYALVGQKVVITNSQNQILLLKRSAKAGAGGKWSLPGGGLERGEKPAEGIAREIEEEVQISVNYLRPFYVKSYLRDDDFIVIIAYKAAHRGGEVQLNWEHDDYLWVSKKDALAMELTPDAADCLKQWTPYEQRPFASAEDVAKLYAGLTKAGINIWLDGGWGVDALLGEQTRPHDDIDIVIEGKDVPALKKYLETLGYAFLDRADSCAWNFVYGDEEGRQIDIHVINIDADHNVSYGPHPLNKGYTWSALQGSGSVNGQHLRCIAAPELVSFHSGYRLRENDFHDVLLLCKKFNLELPAEYQKIFAAREKTSV